MQLTNILPNPGKSFHIIVEEHPEDGWSSSSGRRGLVISRLVNFWGTVMGLRSFPAGTLIRNTRWRPDPLDYVSFGSMDTQNTSQIMPHHSSTPRYASAPLQTTRCFSELRPCISQRISLS